MDNNFIQDFKAERETLNTSTMSYKKTDSQGTVYWYNAQDEIHREDGPAIIYANGYKFWYINGKRHRENGPAAEFGDGYNQWFLNGIKHTKQEYYAKIRLRKLKQFL